MKIHLAQYSTILQYIQIHVNWCFPTGKLLDGNRLARYLQQLPRQASPAPWISERWERDEYYEQVILNRSNTLNKEQVHQIRKFGNDWNFNPEIIARLTGASERQVRDVLSGKYYSRVK